MILNSFPMISSIACKCFLDLIFRISPEFRVKYDLFYAFMSFLLSQSVNMSLRKHEFHYIPSGFIPGERSLCGSCYKLFTAPEIWNNAEAKCRSLGAHLVKIKSDLENDFLTNTLLNGKKGHIGSD